LEDNSRAAIDVSKLFLFVYKYPTLSKVNHKRFDTTAYDTNPGTLDSWYVGLVPELLHTTDRQLRHTHFYFTHRYTHIYTLFPALTRTHAENIIVVAI